MANAVPVAGVVQILRLPVYRPSIPFLSCARSQLLPG